VADWAAAETFESFYFEALSRDQAPARALREAKLSVRRSNALRGATLSDDGDASAYAVEAGHPFFWAPFIYIGLP